MKKYNIEKGVRSLRKHVDENLCEISLNALRTRHPKVFIKTFGCQQNFRDSEIIAGLLQGAGFGAAGSLESADVVLFNTCSVREHAEQRVWGQIRAVARMTNDKCQMSNLSRNTQYARRNTPIIGVIGCMAQNYQSEIFSKLPQVDVVCGPGNIYDLPDLVKRALSGEMHILACDKQKSETNDLSLRTNQVKAFVNIMTGCDNFCSYCIVPYVRGRQISREISEILNEIKCLADNGYKEVTLLGQNVNSFAVDEKIQMTKSKLKENKKSAFVTLLEEVNKISGIERVRFVTSHPKDVTYDLVVAMRDLEKVCESLHLPVQSGSDKILRLMNRKYTSKHYLKLINMLRKFVPEVGLSTDIIVGFPGETKRDFKQTCDLIKLIEFDNVFVFKYSPRPKTKAAEFSDNLPFEVKKERNKIILELAKEIARKKNNKLIGTTQEVLVETMSEKDKTKMLGRTRTDKIALLKGDKRLIGKLVNVKIKEVRYYTLIGEK
ncbi:MAG: tRNA (N6-isopentenyl adenosine(37)-C2)-methylthiotransferase MiaB [Candidatus Omnitrophota bacterium]